jgi:hypothetical protein
MKHFNPQPKQTNLRFTPTEKSYRIWLRKYELPCGLSARPWPDLAHTGNSSDGKGINRKAHLHTLIPLIRPLHTVEENGRDYFWKMANLPDRRDWAARLFDCYEKDEVVSAECLLADMHEKANKDFLAEILAGFDNVPKGVQG